jgi:hypothetical protein
MKTLIRQAREIIAEEAENVYDEFREDDGSMTQQNHIEATRLLTRMENWLDAANRTLGEMTPKRKKKPAPRGVVQRPRRIVVVGGKGSALE